MMHLRLLLKHTTVNFALLFMNTIANLFVVLNGGKPLNYFYNQLQQAPLKDDCGYTNRIMKLLLK